MKITFLGSAAAEGIPSPYCNCTTCAHARKHKGKNSRKRCSYMINEDMLIDMGPDLFTACVQYDVDLLKAKYMLVTHSHLDHFLPMNLGMRAKKFRKGIELPPLTFAAPPSVMSLLTHSPYDDKSMELTRKTVLPYDSFTMDAYHIQTIKASHHLEIGDAVNYLVDDGKKKVLIASDTGFYKDEAWPYLEQTQAETLVIESTVGTGTCANITHLNIEGVQEMVRRLKGIGALKENASIFATHFSHHHCPPHDELSAIFEKLGITCVYDGLIADI